MWFSLWPHEFVFNIFSFLGCTRTNCETFLVWEQLSSVAFELHWWQWGCLAYSIVFTFDPSVLPPCNSISYTEGGHICFLCVPVICWSEGCLKHLWTFCWNFDVKVQCGAQKHKHEFSQKKNGNGCSVNSGIFKLYNYYECLYAYDVFTLQGLYL